MKKNRIRRLCFSLAVTMCLLLLGAGFGAGTASAVTVDAACTAAGTIEIVPGVNITERVFEVTGSGTFANCVENPLNPAPHVLSATWTSTADGFGSCLLLNVNGRLDVTWLLNGGGTDTSVIEYQITAGILPPFALFQLVVTSGRFAGDSVTGTLLAAFFNPFLGCLSDEGVSQASFYAVGIEYNFG